MDTIYVVTPEECCWDGILEGFAINASGLERIIRNRYNSNYYYSKLISVRVDLEAATVVATDQVGDWTYYIREIQSA